MGTVTRIGLVELPAIKLCDPGGKNWTAFRQHEPLVSKQILMAQLRAYGYLTSLINLKCGSQEQLVGEARWRGLLLQKKFGGNSIEGYPADMFDVWGITVNYMQEREIAQRIIRYLASQGGRVVVGGSDALAEPAMYLAAGAMVVVTDKSGAINRSVIEYVMGRAAESEWRQMTVTGGGKILGRRGPALSPEDWPLPDVDVAIACLGTQYWEGEIPPFLLPIGSAIVDIGCDRKCDFCQTPTYKLGYKSMSPGVALKWFAKQKEAGARSVICPSDQFLGRVLWEEGRREVLRIMEGIRELGLSVLWGNGLELKKATVGRGLPGGDLTPDNELCEALWGWDGRIGCYNAYIPGERPVRGEAAYQKLLPWEEHVRLMRTMVQTGIPDISYGIIVGLPDDSADELSRLEDALYELWFLLKRENPNLQFRVIPFSLRPLPGTTLTKGLASEGLVANPDPAVCGGFWTACANTRYMTYEAVSDWQARLSQIGDLRYARHQGVTSLLREASQPQAIPAL